MNQQLKLDKNKFENLDRILFILEEARKQQKNTAFILKNGALLSSINQIKEGDDIEVVFPDGSFYARVGAVRS